MKPKKVIEIHIESPLSHKDKAEIKEAIKRLETSWGARHKEKK